MKQAKSIERIAEELGVNFFVLHPLLSARDEFHLRKGRQEVVDWVENNNHYNDRYDTIEIENREWQDQLNEWEIK